MAEGQHIVLQHVTHFVHSLSILTSELKIQIGSEYSEQGVPLVYEFDDNFQAIKHYYLGDQEALAAKMSAVAQPGKVAH